MQNDAVLQENRQRHFLFHIFRMDKAENPMPKPQVESLMQYLKNIWTEKEKGSN